MWQMKSIKETVVFKNTFISICCTDTKVVRADALVLFGRWEWNGKVSISNTITKFIYSSDIWQVFIFIVCLTNWAKKLLEQEFWWWSHTHTHTRSHDSSCYNKYLWGVLPLFVRNSAEMLCWSEKVFIAIMTPFSWCLSNMSILRRIQWLVGVNICYKETNLLPT